MTEKVFPGVHDFHGLNNVADPQRLGLGWFVQADNVEVTKVGTVQRAKGFARVTTNTAISGAYATKDLKRLYVVDSGELRQMSEDLQSYVVLRTGLSSKPMYFDEVNGVVFFANGVDYGLAFDGYAEPWGIRQPLAPVAVAGNGGSLSPGLYQIVCTLVDSRGLESSNSDVVSVQIDGSDGRILISGIEQPAGYSVNLYATVGDGTVYFLLQEGVGDSFTYDLGVLTQRELPFWNVNQPRGTLPTFFKSKVYTVEYFPALDASALWSSLDLHYHHFDPGAEGRPIPGQIRLCRPAENALIIGTDRQIFAYDGERLTELAAYGVVPGWHGARLGEVLYFWSLRGLCSAMPFANLTESTVSVPPGLSAGAAVVEKDGMRRYVVALHKGGEAFNRRNS